MIPIFAKGFGLNVTIVPYFFRTAAEVLHMKHNSYHLKRSIIVSTAKKIFKRVTTVVKHIVGVNAGETIKTKYYVTSALMYARPLKH